MADCVDETVNDIVIDAILYSDDECINTQSDIFTVVQDPGTRRRNVRDLATGWNGEHWTMRSGRDSCKQFLSNNQNNQEMTECNEDKPIISFLSS